jgi:hypothetical protein
MAAEMNSAYMRSRWPDVFADAPVLPAIDPLDEAIIAAQNQLDSDNWGRNYAEAVVLLAGHIAIMSTGGRASGVQSTKAGQVEVRFGAGGSTGNTPTTGFMELYKQLLSRQVLMRVPI